MVTNFHPLFKLFFFFLFDEVLYIDEFRGLYILKQMLLLLILSFSDIFLKHI